MADEFLEQIFKDSEKGKFLEKLGDYLQKYDKAVVVLIQDKDDGDSFDVDMLMIGVGKSYEAQGILDMGKYYIEKETFRET